MPAINVARTDTFEQQRQKINQIGTQIFNISAGGSDLSTGNLKLGDGSRTNPSLAFVSDAFLGLYKPSAKTIGYVSDGKKILDISDTGLYSFKDIIVRRNLLTTDGLSILSVGQNYDPGQYSGIAFTGGTGTGALASVDITPFSGSVTNSGRDYSPGTYTDVPIVGGTGSRTTASFDVDNLEVNITNSGSNYAPGTYVNVPLQNVSSSGSGGLATILITDEVTPSSLPGTITSAGSGYTVPETELTNIQIINDPTQIFTVTTTANPGTPPPNDVYVINGTTQLTLNLLSSNTYRFDLSDASVSGHTLIFTNQDGTPLNTYDYAIISKGTPGSAGSFVDLILKPNASGTIAYDCGIHAGMGGDVNITSGSVGVYGSGAFANVTIGAGGNVTAFSIVTIGQGYNASDIVSVSELDVGSTGSGFEYTLSTPVYNGSITSVSIENSGLGYLLGDTFTINSADLNNYGSGVVLTASTNPGQVSNFVFTLKGLGYSVSNVLGLPEETSGVNATLNGTAFFASVSLDSATAIVSLTDTSNLFAGMTAVGDGTGTGSLAEGTTILSVDSSTQITLSSNPTITGTTGITFASTTFPYNQITLTSIEGIVQGSLVEVSSGSGSLLAGTTVSSVDSLTNIVTLSNDPALPGNAVLTFTPPFGVGSTAFEFTISALGSIESVSVDDGGNGYSLGDVLSFSPTDLTSPIEYIVSNKNVLKVTFTGTISASTFSVGDTIVYDDGGDAPPTLEIYEVESTGGNLDYLIVDNAYLLTSGLQVQKNGTGTQYTLDTVTQSYKYFIDSGSGPVITPNLTLLVGNQYLFNISDSSNSGREFSLSQHPGGIWGNSWIQNISATLDTNVPQITVSSTTNIQPGMSIEVNSGPGNLVSGTFVVSVDTPTTLTLSAAPLSSGAATLSFRGTQYTQGVTTEANSLLIKILEDTPTLYYYSNASDTDKTGEGGDPGYESTLTIDPNNPKVFGSGFSTSVASLSSDDVITSSIQSEEFFAKNIISNNAKLQETEVLGTLIAPTISGNTASLTSISSNDTLSLNATNSITLNSNVNISSSIQIDGGTGDFSSSGEIKTLDKLNVNDILFLENSEISTSVTSDLILKPGGLTKIDSSTALIIPSGTTLQRPQQPNAENGAIRFNTETGQYEGYNASTTSWSSLGGVRDLDGNTTILAELSIGANDNTLWFINDGVNTVKFTPSYQEFQSVKKVRSINTSAPTFVEWRANDSASVGDYVKYKTNVYEVTAVSNTNPGDTNLFSGTPPTHATGSAQYGDIELTWFITAVAPLTFEEISEIRIGPTASVPMLFEGDLRITKNTIATDLTDITLKPNTGRRIICQSNTHLQIPSGTDSEKSTGTAENGSIRYNTTNQVYEGFNKTTNTWGSLGGVKDVDQNTYIIPELGPGTNENILYFFNDNINTINVSTTTLDFANIDTVTSSGSNSLEITASSITLDNSSTSIDNTGTSTFISTTKDSLDLGVSSGLTNDVVLRLDDEGDVYFNTGFGSGSESLVRVFDKELANLEISKYRITTSSATLTKGTTNNSSAVIYTPASELSAKVEFIAHNTTTGDKEIIEFSVIDKGSDIFYTEVGTIQTGSSLIDYTFDFNVNNAVRLNYSLATGVANANAVNVTVVSNVIKK